MNCKNNIDNLQELIASGESISLEFKEKFDERTIESAVAFANTNGGIILIDISDKGEIKGIQIGKETVQNWANQISQITEPHVIPQIELHEEQQKKVAAIFIKEYPIKPVSVKGRCYIRVGNSDRIMPAQEIAQMHFHSTGMSWDKLPARDATLEDIDLEKVKRYIKKANEAGRRKIENDEEPLEVLEKLDLIKDGKPTWVLYFSFAKVISDFYHRLLSTAADSKKRLLLSMIE